MPDERQSWQMETPPEARRYCPGCEPYRDPLQEILSIFWCGEHEPTQRGALDHVVDQVYINGTGEIDGASNAAWCNFFHGKWPERYVPYQTEAEKGAKTDVRRKPASNRRKKAV